MHIVSYPLPYRSPLAICLLCYVSAELSNATDNIRQCLDAVGQRDHSNCMKYSTTHFWMDVGESVLCLTVDTSHAIDSVQMGVVGRGQP